MQFVKGGHRSGRTAEHWSAVGNTWFVAVDEAEMERSLGVPVNSETVEVAEVARGGVVFLNNLAPHCSTENTTQNIRWSLDLRFNELGQPSGCDKESLLLRKVGDGGYQPDWEKWANSSRTEIQEGGEGD